MKRLLLFIATLLIAVCASAQVEVLSPHPDLLIQFDKCSKSKISNSVYLYLTMTNVSGRDVKMSCLREANTLSDSFVTAAYDDEGNVYYYNYYEKPALSYVSISGEDCSESRDINIPNEIPVKVRIGIIGVDKDATELKLVQLFIKCPDIIPSSEGFGHIKINNISISSK